jgi:uncharacterized protein (TIGR03435 family)
MMLRYLGSVIVLAAGAAGQQAFEVASIKPNAANDNRAMIGMQPGGRFVATGITVKFLIGMAYNLRDFQISGGPGWITAERFDINAKPPEGSPARIPPEQIREMVKALLTERFQLKTRTESKEMPVYSLVVAKNGPKVKPAAAPAEGRGGPGMIRMGRGQLDGNGMAMASLANQIATQVGRPVIDKTGLAGQYDIKLEWTPEPGHGGGPFGGPPPPDALPPADSNGPTIFTAVQEQLGLRLEPAKGPVETLVIESISRPTEN